MSTGNAVSILEIAIMALLILALGKACAHYNYLADEEYSLLQVQEHQCAEIAKYRIQYRILVDNGIPQVSKVLNPEEMQWDLDLINRRRQYRQNRN